MFFLSESPPRVSSLTILLLRETMTFLGKSVSLEKFQNWHRYDLNPKKKKRKRMFRGHFSTFITRTRVVKISIVFLIIPLVIHDAISICFIFTLFSRFTSIVREVGVPRVSMDKEVSRRRNSSQVWMSIRSPRFKIGN